MEKHILDAPCVFCGYNGPGYWQTGTHAKDCPWHDIGSIAYREEEIQNLKAIVTAIRASERSRVIAEIRVGMFELIEWAYGQGRHRISWNYVGGEADKRLDALLGERG